MVDMMAVTSACLSIPCAFRIVSSFLYACAPCLSLHVPVTHVMAGTHGSSCTMLFSDTLFLAVVWW
jgi:hypothetical protein